MSGLNGQQAVRRPGGIEYGTWAAASELAALYALDDAERRLLVHVAMALLEAQAEGHVCLHVGTLAGSTRWSEAEAQPPREGYRFPDAQRLDALLSGLKLRHPEDPAPLRYDPPRLYTRRMWELEQELARRMVARHRQPLEIADAEAARAVLARLFPAPSAEGVEGQRIAVAHALRHPLAVLTGGPGTGKTTTATRLLAALVALSPRTTTIALAAPTGKAAQRLTESVAAQKRWLREQGVDAAWLEPIPDHATTVHRLLGVCGGGDGFVHGTDKPLDLDVLVVDEVSMMDLPLMTALFRALAGPTRVVLLGDPDQLPAVGVGGLLAELVGEAEEPCAQDDARWIAEVGGHPVQAQVRVHAPWHAALRHGHRFAPHSDIGRIAAALQDGDVGTAKSLLAGAQAGPRDLVWQPAWDEALLLETGAPHWHRLLQARSPEEAFRLLAAFRVLTPLRQGPLGVEQLNRRIEQYLNLGAGSAAGSWYRGRPIMVTRNHYGVGLFNGDVGLVWEVNGQNMALFEAGSGMPYRSFPIHRLPEVETVFAMTVHKTQGSEFDEVLLLLPPEAERLLSRELVFTGLTRARQRCTVLAEEAVWDAAVARRVVREGGLRKALLAALQQA